MYRKNVLSSRLSVALSLLVFLCSAATAQGKAGLKVFISVDMEGITGVVDPEDVSRSGKDYDYFRKIMTREANAAIEGARAAGATEIVVRDAHGTALNLLPDLLDRDAKLLRGWSGAILNMVEGIDASFDAAVFVGYHAKAGTANAVLDHTSTGDVVDLSINGISMPEAGIMALLAGYYRVPVVFLSGDQAICDHARSLFGKLETVAVKEGIGSAALNLHPEVAIERIRAGVEAAVRGRARYKPYTLRAPLSMVLKLNREQMVFEGALYPGVKRTGDWELTYVAKDMLDLMLAYRRVRLTK
jgi:D-amino peptidase